MAILYRIRYRGAVSLGFGSVVFSQGRLLGIDLTGARIEGHYAPSPEGGVSGTCDVVSVGAPFVSGQTFPAGTRVAARFTLPADYEGGGYTRIDLGGQPIEVAFEKVGELP